MQKIIIWGASGHAKVLLPILQKDGLVPAFMVDRARSEELIPNVPVFKDFPALKACDAYHQAMALKAMSFCVAIGGIFGRDRVDIHKQLSLEGLLPKTLIHARSWVADTAKIGAGSQILGMAAVSEEVCIGIQTIVNTNASIDHETVIGNGCHIMPGATIAGCVQIGDYCTIGSNATILPRITIGEGAIIGAGSVVTRDVPAGKVFLGIPAKEKSTA